MKKFVKMERADMFREMLDKLQIKQAEHIRLLEVIEALSDIPRLYTFANDLVMDLEEEIQGLESDVVELVDNTDDEEQTELENIRKAEFNVNPYIMSEE